MPFARTPALLVTLGLVILLALSACGPRLVRGQPPYVNIRVLDASEENLSLRLRVQNINGVSIELTRVRFSIDLGDQPLGRFDGPRQTSIIANGSETLRFELEASSPGRALLSSLEQREIPNLEYRIEGEFETVDEGTLNFSGSGRIYPVPGRPGQFR
jgi:LEA14-like dessication related protein